MQDALASPEGSEEENLASACWKCCSCGTHPVEMSNYDRLKLSWYQKWRRFGLPPFKFIVGILLTLSVSISIFVFQDSLSDYTRAQKLNWESIIIPDGLDYSGYSSDYTYYIYTLEELLALIASMTNTYYTLPNNTVGNYLYMYEGNSTSQVKPVTLEMQVYRYWDDIFTTETQGNRHVNGQIDKETYLLYSSNDFGPFNDSNQSMNLVHSMKEMKIWFQIENIDFDSANDDLSGTRDHSRTCFVNRVEAHIHFYYRGRLNLKMAPQTWLCESEFKKSVWHRSILSAVIIAALTIVFSLISQYLYFKAVYKRWEIYREERRKHEEWKSLSWTEFFEFFGIWVWITTIANVCNITGNIYLMESLLITNKRSSWDTPFFFIGIGTMFTWISLVQFLESFPRLYFLISTLRISGPRVLYFLVGVLPIFIGFSCFGVCYFSSDSELFGNLDTASVTLFALLNGDVIHDTFNDIYGVSPVISRIYLYIFVSLFIYAVLNIFIAIVEDAFFLTKTVTESEQKEEANLRIVSNDNWRKEDVINLLQGPPVSMFGSPLTGQDDSSNRHSPGYVPPSSPGNGTVVHSRMMDESGNQEDGTSEISVTSSVLSRGATLDYKYQSSDPALPGANSGHLGEMNRSQSVTNLFKSKQVSSRPPNKAPSPRLRKNKAGMSRTDLWLWESTRTDEEKRYDEFLKVMKEMTDSYANQTLNVIDECLRNVLLSDTDSSSFRLRPPHDPQSFPCGFDDCLYCLVRKLLSDHLDHARSRIKQSMDVISLTNPLTRQGSFSGSGIISIGRQLSSGSTIVKSGRQDSFDLVNLQKESVTEVLPAAIESRVSTVIEEKTIVSDSGDLSTDESFDQDSSTMK